MEKLVVSLELLHGTLPDALVWPSLSSWWLFMILKHPHWPVMSP